MIQIDGAMALDLMADVVREHGENYVYPQAEPSRCMYVVDGQPSCLVGKALALAGVPVADLEALDNEGVAFIVEITLPPSLALDDDARRIFGEAQAQQDMGTAWGAALATAEDYAACLFADRCE